MLQHSEVKWLSRGNCQKQVHLSFSNNCRVVLEHDNDLSGKLKAIDMDDFLYDRYFSRNWTMSIHNCWERNDLIRCKERDQVIY